VDRQLKKGGEGELRRRLLRYAGRRIAKRYTYKAVPLIASPLSAIENARATSALGDRALAYYGG
jgi:hypothetical protein